MKFSTVTNVGFALETYLIFVALQCLAAPIAIFLTRPEKVQRGDGSKVKIVLQDSWAAEMKELWKLSCRKDVSFLRVRKCPITILMIENLGSAASPRFLGIIL
jgi:hypothetical protein